MPLKYIVNPKRRASKPLAIRFSCKILVLILWALGGRSFAKEADSIPIFDKMLSFQSSLSVQEQIATTRKAERYAQVKGDVYKRFAYAARRGYLYFSADNSDSCLQVYSALIPDIEKQVEQTGEERWKVLLVECYSDIALSMMYKEESDSAMLIYQGLLFRFEKDSIPLVNARCLNGIGVIFAYRKLFDLAEKNLLAALKQYSSVNDRRGIFTVSSNMVALFQTQGLFEESLPYGIRAYRIAHDENYNGQELIYASLAMGSIYSGMMRYDIALPYFEEAVKLAREKKFAHIESFVESSYAWNLFYLEQYAQARQVAEDALRQIKDKKKYALQVDLLHLLSQVSEKQNDVESALHYLKEYIVVRDSQMALENMRQLLGVQDRYDSYRQAQTTLDKANELRLATARARNRGGWIIGLSVAVALLAAAIAFLFKRLVRSGRMEELLKEESRRQIKTAEEQVEVKNKELATNALQFLRLNNLQESILKELRQLKTAFTLRGKEKRMVCDIEELAKQIASEREWKDFQFYFEQVDKDFFRQLSERYPDLTSNEKHLCVLFKLGLTNKDVASLTGRSLQSIGMAKFRLKTKLQADNAEDLNQFLNSL